MDDKINKIKSLKSYIDNILKSFNINDLKNMYNEEAYHTRIIRNYLLRILSKQANKLTATDNQIIEEVYSSIDIYKILFLSILTILFIYEAFIFNTKDHTEIMISFVCSSLIILIYTISTMRERSGEYFIYCLLMIVLVPITGQLLEDFKELSSLPEKPLKIVEILVYLIILFIIPSIYHRLTNNYLLKMKIKRLSKVYKKYKQRINELSPKNIDINI